MIGRKGAGTMLDHAFFVNHRAQDLIRDNLNFGDLVGGAEAVKEMEEREPRFQGGGMETISVVTARSSSVGLVLRWQTGPATEL